MTGCIVCGSTEWSTLDPFTHFTFCDGHNREAQNIYYEKYGASGKGSDWLRAIADVFANAGK